MNYYNDNDPFAAQWLRNLIDARLLPKGHVDERSITEIDPQTLRAYTQCHFFAGIGGWPLALSLAGWPADEPVWTGSCPCQPLSNAGKRYGAQDERHLWPEFYRIIGEYRPGVVFGEQVASDLGLEWLDGISLDLEECGYAVGASDLPAACVGAPNIRQRLWWVAHAERDGREQRRPEREGQFGRASSFGASGGSYGLGVSNGSRSQQGDKTAEGSRHRHTAESACSWNEYRIASCRDGKQRRIPVEPALFPLADGIPGRVGLLKGAGNAINPWVAAEFIRAFMEIKQG